MLGWKSILTILTKSTVGLLVGIMALANDATFNTTAAGRCRRPACPFAPATCSV